MICQGALCPAKKSALKVSWMSAQWTRGIAASACGAFCTSSGTFSRRYKAWPPPEFHNAIPRRSSSISAGASTTGTSRSKNLSTVSFGASRFRRSGVCSKFPTRVKRLPVFQPEFTAPKAWQQETERKSEEGVLFFPGFIEIAVNFHKWRTTWLLQVLFVSERPECNLNWCHMSTSHFLRWRKDAAETEPPTYKPHVSGSRQNCRFSKPMQS